MRSRDMDQVWSDYVWIAFEFGECGFQNLEFIPNDQKI